MQFLENLKQQAKKLKSEGQVLMVAYTDERTPLIAKVLIWLTIGYLLSPIDLIPDFIPVLGMLDDLIIVPLLIRASLKLIPPAVLADARAKLLNDPKRLKKANWLFAVIIILIWSTLLYAAWQRIDSFWK